MSNMVPSQIVVPHMTKYLVAQNYVSEIEHTR